MRRPSSVRASWSTTSIPSWYDTDTSVPIEEPECCLIMPINPSVIVFARAVFFGVNHIEPFIQIDFELWSQSRDGWE